MLRHIIHALASGKLAHAPVKILQPLERKSIVEADHRHLVPIGLKSGARLAAHALRRRIRRDQLGMLRFERLELIHQLVVAGVGNLRIIQDVVEVIVPVNIVAQALDFLSRRARRGFRSSRRFLFRHQPST